MLVQQTRLNLTGHVRVTQIDTAFDSTFVILYSDDPFYPTITKKLMHIGHEVIAKYETQDYVKNFIMFQPDKVLYIRLDSKKLVLLNLRTKQQQKVINLDILGGISIRNLFFFNQTRFIAIWQQLLPSIRLEYLNSQFESIYVDNFTQDLHHFREVFWSACKGNDSQMIIFHRVGANNRDECILYEIQKKDGQYVKKNTKIASVYLSGGDIIHYRQYDKDLILGIVQQQRSRIFYINIADKSIKRINSQLSSVDLKMKVYFMKDKICIIGQLTPEKSINFFLELKDKRIQTIAKSTINSNQYAPIGISTDGEAILQFQGDLIRKITKIAPRQMYMHLLLHLNEDFDDDLLFDTINLVHDD